MWKIHLTCFFVVAFFLCQCTSMPKETMGPKNYITGIGSLNRYFLSSWNNLVAGGNIMVPIANSDAGVAAATLTGSEDMAIVVHGRQSRVHSEFGVTLRDSLIQADKSMAVILVDWEFAASYNYAQTVALLPLVASNLVDFITRLVDGKKLNLDRLHLIGFDLGAHVVGIVGRQLPTQAGKITGLGPAGETWDLFSPHLRSTDARVVEVIHTDVFGSAAFGIGTNIGSLDFYPNGGTMQPGCEEDDNVCYHNMAWRLFAASLHSRGELVGYKCENMEQMFGDLCAGVPVAVMGSTLLDKPYTGIYRVNTGNYFPYVIEK